MKLAPKTELELKLKNSFKDGLETEYRFHPTRRWRIDYAWPSRKIGIEYEGGTWSGGRHIRGKYYSNDCEKYNHAQLLGWKIYRFTADMIKDSYPFLEEILGFTVLLLPGNKEALVDNEDFDRIKEHFWYFVEINGCAYVQTIVGGRPKKKTVRLHQMILEPPKGLIIDHIDGNGLDNRKFNLRVCTKRQNSMNRKKSSGTSSKYKGATWYSKTGKWMAQIVVNKKRVHLGYFAEESEAALAYNEAAKHYFGEFARLNDIVDKPNVVVNIVADG